MSSLFKQIVPLVGLTAFALMTGCQTQSPTYVSAPSMGGPTVQQSRNISPPIKPIPQDPPQYDPPVGPRASARAWVPNAAPWPWRWIVIHHSDTINGSAASFDAYHRNSRHWQSLGYHFVIDNGNGGPDGRVEVGPRWKDQSIGAHAGVYDYNRYGIGICLVGNFDNSRPTPAQMRSLAQLTAYLMRRYHISADSVIGHRDVRGKSTRCPGRYMNIENVRRMAVHLAAMDPLGLPGQEILAAQEMDYLYKETE